MVLHDLKHLPIINHLPHHAVHVVRLWAATAAGEAWVVAAAGAAALMRRACQHSSKQLLMHVWPQQRSLLAPTWYGACLKLIWGHNVIQSRAKAVCGVGAWHLYTCQSENRQANNCCFGFPGK
jgi:hypothetical protein